MRTLNVCLHFELQLLVLNEICFAELKLFSSENC